jgi:uncharacterized protein
MSTVAIIGASTDPTKYGNRAVRAYVRQGYTVFPVNPKVKTIEGLRAYASVGDIPGPVDRVSLYLPPQIGLKVLPEIAKKKPAEFFVNPGADSEQLMEEAKKLGIEPILACSIIEVGETPEAL